MSVNITISSFSGRTLFTTAKRLSDGFLWDAAGSAWAASPTTANQKITATEGAAANLGSYTATVTGMGDAGSVQLLIHNDVDVNDITVAAFQIEVWGGDEVQISSAGRLAIWNALVSAMTVVGSIGKKLADWWVGTINSVYYADVKLVRNQNLSKDEYTVVWYKDDVPVTSGISAANIQVILRSDATNLIAATAMTQIGTTGFYKYDASGGERLTLGEPIIAKLTATIDGSTRNCNRVLGRDI